MRKPIQAVAFSLLLVVAGCGGGDERSNLSSLPPCGGAVELTALPLAQGDFTSIVPLGNLSPSDHTLPTEHHYFVLPLDPANPDRAQQVPVLAATRGTVVEVEDVEHVNRGFHDYDLTLGVCRDFSVHYGHLSQISEALRAELGTPTRCDTYTTGGNTYRRCKYRLHGEVAAGEELGRAGGNPEQYALDLGAKDYRREQNAYANPARYRNEATFLLYAVSPLDYLTPELQDAVDPKMGDFEGNRRTREPLHGQIAYDVAGTAMGNWFREGEPFFPEDPHLVLVKDNVDPGLYAISAGTSLGALAGRVVRFSPEAGGSVNRPFEQLTPGGTYCYPTEQPGTTTPVGRVLLRLQDSGRLQAEFQPGKGCSETLQFVSAAVFVR
ncbi:hypothetical protein ACMC9I_01075 [Deinococcota bacterium DY0809b]